MGLALSAQIIANFARVRSTVLLVNLDIKTKKELVIRIVSFLVSTVLLEILVNVLHPAGSGIPSMQLLKHVSLIYHAIRDRHAQNVQLSMH